VTLTVEGCFMVDVLRYVCDTVAYIGDVVSTHLKMFCTFGSVVAITFHSAHVCIHVSSHIHTLFVLYTVV
jgi:hypothetical protein